MAKGKKRLAEFSKKRAQKRSAMLTPGGASRYAQKRDGSAAPEALKESVPLPEKMA